MVTYQYQRVTYDDGCWADVHTAKLPADALAFMDFETRGKRAQLVDTCKRCLIKAERRGEDNPLAIVYETPERGPIRDVFPSAQAIVHEGETLLDAVSFVNCIMWRIVSNCWASVSYERASGAFALDLLPDAIPQSERHNVQLVWDWLTCADRLYVHGLRPDVKLTASFDAHAYLVGIAPHDFLSDLNHVSHHALLFNTAFFLLEPDDYASVHSRLGEAYNLYIKAGEIVRPPLYQRAAYLHGDDGQVWAQRVSMQHVEITLPNSLRLIPDENLAINPTVPHELTLYTRTHNATRGEALTGRTPNAPGRLELVIVDQHIVGWKRDGDLHIPQNGYVLSFAPDVAPDTQHDAWLGDLLVTYTPEATLRGVQQGLQGGPLLLAGSEIALDAHTLRQEEFYPQQGDRSLPWHGVVPKYFPFDVDQTRAARVGIGVTASGEVVVVAVDGVNGGNRDERDSYGATLLELAQHLQSAGAVDAINLDGGGSTQMFVHGGQVTRSSNRRASRGLLYERMVPSIGLAHFHRG